jgi:hypothetical protein
MTVWALRGDARLESSVTPGLQASDAVVVAEALGEPQAALTAAGDLQRAGVWRGDRELVGDGSVDRRARDGVDAELDDPERMVRAVRDPDSAQRRA